MTAKIPNQKENDIIQDIRRVFARLPFVMILRNREHYNVLRDSYMPGLDCRGSSDLIGMVIVPGKGAIFLAIEVKQPGKKPTKDQVAFLHFVAKHGGVAGWADSVDSAAQIILEARGNLATDHLGVELAKMALAPKKKKPIKVQ